MGIPYSKQIDAAFDQVTPLVAEGFKVLETTKNISILLAAIQVLTVILLLFILGALTALLITCNPDLAHERQTLVTPVLKWFAAWIVDAGSRRYLGLVLFVLVFGALIGAAGGFFLVRRSDLEDVVKREQERECSTSEHNNNETQQS
jgi:hypothetical protein